MKARDTTRARRSIKLRRGIALPFYFVALILSYLSDAFAKLAALIAQDSF